MVKAPEKMSDDVLLDQINCFDPYDVEFAKRYRAQAARIEALEAQVAAADALARHASAQLAYMDLCDDKGDFERNLRAALAAYNEAKKDCTPQVGANGEGRKREVKKSIVMAFRKVENGYVMELVTDQNGLIGSEYIAATPSVLRGNAKAVLEEKLEDLISEMLK